MSTLKDIAVGVLIAVVGTVIASIIVAEYESRERWERSPNGKLAAKVESISRAPPGEGYEGGLTIRVKTGDSSRKSIPVSFDSPGPYDTNLRFDGDDVLLFTIGTRGCVIDFAGGWVYVCRSKTSEWTERQRQAGHQIFSPLGQNSVSGTYRLYLNPSGELKDTDPP